MPPWRRVAESQKGEPAFKRPPSKPTGPVIGAGAPTFLPSPDGQPETAGPRQSGAYNTPEEPASMELEEPPAASLQLPKIGGACKDGIYSC
eukprot:12414130-Karenia_brevis.AAC.1